MLLKMLEGIHNNQVHKDSTPADTTHIELVVSAGFVLFFDFVAGPFPAIAFGHVCWTTLPVGHRGLLTIDCFFKKVDPEGAEVL
ncbi:uncharacterized protein [Lolium perenne]|uniref:uncharacterized protein isoform X3 n=1 Tax=Lolium perenne TaxID=4522 RepID=UPI003A9A554F